MATSQVAVFESTLQKTHQWLAELVDTGQFESEGQAYTAMRAVLHALRDRLTVEEATDLGAQLPMLIRGFYYEGWNPSKTPVTLRHRDDFIDGVRHALRNAAEAIDAEQATMAVFGLLSLKVTAGEIGDVRQQLPPAIRGLWP
ncbi:MAG: DUF2267 domain-containing protein [Phycisphaeraceae bacterium]